MADHIDKEIEAIKAVLLALEPLPPEVRTSVLEYVLGRLQIALRPVQQTGVSGALAPSADARHSVPEPIARQGQKAKPPHIKDAKEKKKPRSANEMAALVAYYLENEAPPEDRKDRITTKDIETYFKIAGFRLPKRTQSSLVNAKAAGYLDAVGNGEYKLNAVGYNLVVHNLPRGTGGEAPARSKRRKRARPAAKKKAKAPTKKK